MTTEAWGAELLDKAREREEALASAMTEQMAVLATFDPSKIEGPDVPKILRTLASPLKRRQGRKRGEQEDSGWTLNERPRIAVLARVLERGGVPELAQVRDGIEKHFDTPLQTALDEATRNRRTALVDQSPDQLSAALQVRRWMSDAAAEARVSDRVDLGPSPEAIRGALAQHEMMAPFEALLVNGCIGRDDKIAQLHAWREGGPPFGDFAADNVMLVHGIGGMGKSTMMAKFITDLHWATQEGSRQGWAYIDFDRLMFRSGRTGPVFDEIVQQVGVQFPDLRRLGDAMTDISRTKESGQGLESFESSEFDKERIYHVGGVLEEVAERDQEPFVIVLDTFEEMQARGSTDYGRPWADILFEALHALGSQVPRLRVVISGRSRPELSLLSVPEEHVVEVGELEGGDARDLLNVFVKHHDPDMGPLPVEWANEVIRLVGGSPLTLKLAARVLADQGKEALKDAARRAAALGQVRDEFVRGFLYRRIIEHLDPRDEQLRTPLRAVARAALAMRLVTSEAIEKVLIPALGGGIDLDAQTLFRGLHAHTSLHQMRKDDILALHEDLRRPALAALRFDDAELVAAVHEHAIAFYRIQSEPWAAAELAYHRLMMGEAPDDLGALLTPEVLSSLNRSAADLPPVAADVVSMQHDQAAAQMRKSAKARAAEIDAESRADSALRSGDLDAARDALAKLEDRIPTSKLHRIESRIHEAAGDLEEAIEAQLADLGASSHAAHPRRVAAAAVRLSRLFERFGESEEALRALESTERGTLLHGHPLLRSELQLRRLNVAERRKLWKRDRRRAEERSVREFVKSVPRPDGAAWSVQLRLIAAALGKGAPTAVSAALEQVGVGTAFGPEAVAELADALDKTRNQHDWIQVFPSEDTIVYGDGEFDKEAIARHLGALGPSDAPFRLREIFEIARKEKIRPVMDAVRGIYLWWDMQRPEREEVAGAPPVDPDAPLDFRNEDVRQLAETLRHAYPEQAHLRRLADKAKVSLEDVRRTKSHAGYTRDIMKAAHGKNRLNKLVEIALKDPESKAFHPRLRNIVKGL